MPKQFPQGRLEEIPPVEVGEIVSSLKELYDKGKPETDEEVEQRINDYFSYCANSSIRPGIESLAMSLHVSRITLFNWSKGLGCSEKCQELISSAKMVVSAYLEQALLQGKVSPPSGIFLAKNWLGYKDSISIEESIPSEDKKKPLSISDLKLLDLRDYSSNLNEGE